MTDPNEFPSLAQLAESLGIRLPPTPEQMAVAAEQQEMENAANIAEHHRVLESLTDEQLQWFINTAGNITFGSSPAALSAYHLGAAVYVRHQRQTRI